MKERDSLKGESKSGSNYYWKVLFTIATVMAAVIILVNFLELRFQKDLKESSQYVMDEYYRCEIHYKELDYKGVCDGELLDNIKSMVEFDMQFKLLELCTDSPYAYRYGICNELGTR